MEKLSAVIITFNEEKNITRCINSVLDLADDIVVIDSFSTDQTRAICENLGARFIQQKWLGYVAQKNYALIHAHYDLVLYLDADEALSEDLKKSIMVVKEYRNANGYTMNRLTNYCGKWIKHCGWYPDRKLRLFDRRKGKWAGIDPHDRFEMIHGASVEHLPGNLLHYSYYTIGGHITQAVRFAEIASISMHNKGVKGKLWKVVIKPIVRFIKVFIIRGGFRDGYYGYIIARISAMEVLMKYIRLQELPKRAS